MQVEKELPPTKRWFWELQIEASRQFDDRADSEPTTSFKISWAWRGGDTGEITWTSLYAHCTKTKNKKPMTQNEQFHKVLFKKAFAHFELLILRYYSTLFYFHKVLHERGFMKGSKVVTFMNSWSYWDVEAVISKQFVRFFIAK